MLKMCFPTSPFATGKAQYIFLSIGTDKCREKSPLTEGQVSQKKGAVYSIQTFIGNSRAQHN